MSDSSVRLRWATQITTGTSGSSHDRPDPHQFHIICIYKKLYYVFVAHSNMCLLLICPTIHNIYDIIGVSHRDLFFLIGVHVRIQLGIWPCIANSYNVLLLLFALKLCCTCWLERYLHIQLPAHIVATISMATPVKRAGHDQGPEVLQTPSPRQISSQALSRSPEGQTQADFNNTAYRYGQIPLCTNPHTNVAPPPLISPSHGHRFMQQPRHHIV